MSVEPLAEMPAVALEVGGFVAPLAVERVLDRHRDVGPLGDRVRVVRVDVVDVDHHLHRRVAERAGAVDLVDFGVGLADHHHAVADAQPSEDAGTGINARLADLLELEHTRPGTRVRRLRRCRRGGQTRRACG